MKKILLISIFLFLICIVKNVSAVEDYNTFQEVDIYSGKMLDDYTTEEYNKYYKNYRWTRYFPSHLSSL